MIKLLFFDYRDHEIVDGFVRQLQPPIKHPANPLLVSDHPHEGGRMSFYGSVVRRPEDGLFQMWYTVNAPDGALALAYAESDDGIAWDRPALDAVQIDGGPSHLVFTQRPHGATVIHDPADPRPGWRYKMLCGSAPSDRISAFCSPDGIHWLKAAENPVIGTHPDCPMSLHRAEGGRYVVYVRPAFGDRRVARRESWDFVHWSEPRMVIDQDPRDHPQTQFYGLGALPYGPYEIGTLWIYETVAADMGFNKMEGHQHPELVYSRSGYAWHRAALGQPWIDSGAAGSWEWGMIQPASSPVYLEDEIRFYYAGTRTDHGHHLPDGREHSGPQPRCGIGFASLAPDRFVGIVAEGEGVLLTRPFAPDTSGLWLNAVTAPGGEVRVGVETLEGLPIPGFGPEDTVPFRGDALRHRLAWRGSPDEGALLGQEIRLRVQARSATLYALMSGDEAQVKDYARFDIPGYLTRERLERERRP